MEAGIFFFFAAIVAAIVIRLAAGGLDRDRIRQYVESMGGKLLEIHWSPFGPGWFGEKSDRIYEVRYLDRDGNNHHAHCKTSLWTGVYFTQDFVSGPTEHRTERPAISLEDENRLLREELARLRSRND